MEDLTYRIAGIVDGTTVDGPGFRTSIYFAGCHHRCPGCHNPETWPFDAGEVYTAGELLRRIGENDFDVTFSGGDPMYSAAAIVPLARSIRETGRSIWCYTGFTVEQILDSAGPMRELLNYVDVLVDGPYVEALRNTDLLFRGSSNQRLVDVAATLRAGKVVEKQLDVDVF